MAECPYCLERGNHFILAKVDETHEMEVTVVTTQKPYLMVHACRSNGFGDWRIGFWIHYCPMCGRRLTDG